MLRRPSANFKLRKGQNTVEYLLMLAVITGVVLIAGVALKNYIPKLFAQIQGMIGNAAQTLGSPTGGSQ